MKFLALEFSSVQRSVAVKTESKVIETGGSGMRPFEQIEEALREAHCEREQIECIAIGLGPGSYTGIRAAISLAQGWQLARGVKLLGISSAEAIAAEAQASRVHGRINVVVDAQREEFYLAVFDVSASGYSEVTPLHITSKAEIQSIQNAGGLVVGPEVTKWFGSGKEMFPRAVMVARLALTRTDFVNGQEMTPIYLREVRFVKAPPPKTW